MNCYIGKKVYLLIAVVAVIAIALSWCFSQLSSLSEEYAKKAEKEMERSPSASAERASANALMAIYQQDKEHYQKINSALEKIIEQNNQIINLNQEILKILKEKATKSTEK